MPVNVGLQPEPGRHDGLLAFGHRRQVVVSHRVQLSLKAPDFKSVLGSGAQSLVKTFPVLKVVIVGLEDPVSA